MRLACALAVTGVAIGLLAGRSFANSSHQVTNIAAVKKGGRVNGAEITVRLKSSNHQSALVGLGYPKKNANLHTPQGYMHVRDKGLGYIIQELGTIEVGKGQVVERAFKVMFGEGNDLKAGDEFEVYSFWDSAHLWGSNRHESIKEPIYKLPEDK